MLLYSFSRIFLVGWRLRFGRFGESDGKATIESSAGVEAFTEAGPCLVVFGSLEEDAEAEAEAGRDRVTVVQLSGEEERVEAGCSTRGLFVGAWAWSG